MDFKKEFIKVFNMIGRSIGRHEVFKDFVTISAISLNNAVNMIDSLEVRYFDIIKKYTKEDLKKFCELLSIVVNALEVRKRDFLGEVYMDIGTSNKYMGQFFTPYTVSQMMAKLTLGDDLEELINKKGYISLNEPSCGAGSMCIAIIEEFQLRNINYHNKLFIQAIDIDECCSMMAYMQLALYHVPAQIITGNTLNLDYRQVLYTPAYVMGGWHFKLKREKAEQEAKELITSTENKKEEKPKKEEQKINPVFEQSFFDF